ncbi:MAG: hypothetical protein ABIR64_10255 [Candidatus Limnocylindrales bacterium]
MCKGQKNRGGPVGHDGGNKREGQDEMGQHTDMTPNRTDGGETTHGRSESSPGHMKKAAGAQSARDFAPGNLRRADRGTVEPDRPRDDERRND